MYDFTKIENENSYLDANALFTLLHYLVVFIPINSFYNQTIWFWPLGHLLSHFIKFKSHLASSYSKSLL